MINLGGETIRARVVALERPLISNLLIEEDCAVRYRAAERSVNSVDFVSSRCRGRETKDEYRTPGLGEKYIDLPHTILSISVQIRPTIHKEPSKDGDTTDYVGPVNNFMHSLFNQVDVFFNQKLISPPNNAYAYRAYIETLLNYGPAAKNSHLTSVLWYEDKSGHNFNWDEVDILDIEPSYSKRLISEMIHIKKQKNGINKQNDTDSLPEIYSNIIQSLSPS
ncbi:hypothetical protein ALC62_13978 [Cyphomyrmex costatus]|uniref:Uncharacterized protein n=1 Tax=Cyphomyrmex costatus TaxID=456900 RepID=A0A151I994_9HYME|nr:hypothetical protein ALC62_13978 [Cyphomyrmex costatus]